jgi:hypothetical protein
MIVPSEFSQTIFQQSHHGNAWQMLPHISSQLPSQGMQHPSTSQGMEFAQVNANVQVMVSELVK